MSSPYREGPPPVTLRSLVIPRFFLHQLFCVLSGAIGALMVALPSMLAQGCSTPEPTKGCGDKFFSLTAGSFECDPGQRLEPIPGGHVCRCPTVAVQDAGAHVADAGEDE